MHAVEHSRKLILARLLHRKIRNETAETVYTCLFVYCSIFVVCQTNNNSTTGSSAVALQSNHSSTFLQGSGLNYKDAMNEDVNLRGFRDSNLVQLTHNFAPSNSAIKTAKN